MSRYTDGTYLHDNPTWHAEDSAWKLAHVRRGLARAEIAAPRTVCDLGCGSGELVKLWAKAQPEISFTGYDISPQALSLCKQNAPQNTVFVSGQNIPDGPFDVALALDVIEHIENETAWLKNAAGVAQTLVLHIPLELSLYTRLRSSWLAEQRRVVGHIHFYTPRAVEQLLAQQNLRVLSWHYTNKYVERPPQLNSLTSKIGMCVRKVLHTLLPRRVAALTVGGYSVLCVVSRGKASGAV